MINKKLEDVMLCLTDRISLHTCTQERGIEHPKYLWWKFALNNKNNRSNTLYLAVRDKPYSEIAENLYEAVTGIKILFNRIKQEDKKVLYKSIVENKNYNK
jgi:hypothetical protein